MDPACIRHTDLPGTSKLFADLCYDYPRVARFYRHDPHSIISLEAAAKSVDYPAERRAAMARALGDQNPPGELLTRFAQPGAAAVITGQQVGLFGGPAYTIYKALTAVRIASELSQRGTPAVPIFWMATEDHDFAETDNAWVFDSSQQPHRLKLDPAEEWNGRPRPAGTYAVRNPPLDELRTSLIGFPHVDDVVAAVEEAYCPGSTMGSAFRSLLRILLSRIGILTVDPLHPAIRSIGAPLMAAAALKAAELRRALSARGKELLDAGYHQQVLVDDKTSLSFLLEHGERIALRVPDQEIATFADRPESLSPNALLRPVWQDYMFPTAVYVGGPGELAYFAQAGVLYDGLAVRMPAVVSRAFFTLLDSRAEKILKRCGLRLTDVMVHKEALRERIAHALAPESLGARFEETAAQTNAGLDRLGEELKKFDPTLDAAMAKSRSKILYQIEKLRRKAEREGLRRDQRAAADAEYLGNLVYPEGHLQERLYSILPFLAKHGLQMVDHLYEQIRVDCVGHRVITL